MWAQVRPTIGGRRYVLQERRGGRWVPIGGVATAGTGGIVHRVVQATKGAELRIVDAAAGITTPTLTLS